MRNLPVLILVPLLLTGCQQENQPVSLPAQEQVEAEPSEHHSSVRDFLGPGSRVGGPSVSLEPAEGELDVHVEGPTEYLQPLPEREPLEAPRPCGLMSAEVVIADHSEREPLIAPSPRGLRVPISVSQFETVGPDQALQISFDDLNLLHVLGMEKTPLDVVDYFPDWLRELDGKRVRIKGMMYPTPEEYGLKGFAMQKQLNVMNFGADEEIYEYLVVSLEEGTTTPYIHGRKIMVEGVFHIQPFIAKGRSNQDRWFDLYRMTDAKIIPIPRR